MRNNTKIRSGVPPYDITAEIIRTSMRHDQTNPEPEKRPQPCLTWLADSDCRITPDLVVANYRNRIYAVRNLGFQLSTSFGAVDYGVRQLHTPILLVTGNTDNQAIYSIMDEYDSLGPAIRRELGPLKTALGIKGPKKGGKPDKNFDLKWRLITEKNVDIQVETALDRYSDRVKNGRLVVIGGVLDLTGEYGRGRKCLIIINVNGEKNNKQLKMNKIFSKVPPAMLGIVGRATARPSEKPLPANQKNSDYQ